MRLVAACAFVGPAARRWAKRMPFSSISSSGKDPVDDVPALQRRRREQPAGHDELACPRRARPARPSAGCRRRPGVSPTTASTRPNWADSAAQIMSQPSATSRPAVRQRPWTSARVGISSASSRRTPSIRGWESSEALAGPGVDDRLEVGDVDAAGEDVPLGAPDERPRVGALDLGDAVEQRLPGVGREQVQRRVREHDRGHRRRRARAGSWARSCLRASRIRSARAAISSVLAGRRNPWQLQRIVVVSRDHVDVEVEDRLPGGRASRR